MKKAKKSQFIATRFITKKKYNKTTKKFESEVTTDKEEVLIVSELVEGGTVEVLDENAEKVPAADADYMIPAEGVIITVVEGAITAIEEVEAMEDIPAEDAPVEEPKKKEEPKKEGFPCGSAPKKPKGKMAEVPEEEVPVEEEPKEEMEIDPEVVTKLADFEARIAALEEALAALKPEAGAEGKKEAMSTYKKTGKNIVKLQAFLKK